jgi:hypothetical protein
MKVYQYYKELPQWAKGLVVVGGVAIVYFTSKSILDSIRARKNQAAQLREVDNANTELIALAKKGIKPTLPQSNYEALSNSLVDAFNGCGTDFSKVKSIFDQLKNQADALLFVKTFGLRKKQRCLFSDDPRESFWSNFTPPMSLSAHLASDLSSSNIATINKMLKAKNITLQF